MRPIGLILLAIAVCACNDATAKRGELVFRFSAIPDEKLTEQRERFEPVAEYLADKLGVRVEYREINRYSASVQAFKNGDIQAAWFGGLSGVQARLAVPGSRAIAQGDADPTYYSYFIAHKGSGLEPGPGFPKAAKGKTFTFGSEGSTSGRLMPEFFIREATGQAPNEFFSRIGFSGTHPRTIAMVNSGTFDIGALNYKVYDKADAVEKANTFILWKTPVYTDYNFTVLGDLDATYGAGFTEKLARAFLAMPSDLCEKSFSRRRMIEAKNSDYRKIEETARSLGLAR